MEKERGREREWEGMGKIKSKLTVYSSEWLRRQSPAESVKRQLNKSLMMIIMFCSTWRTSSSSSSSWWSPCHNDSVRMNRCPKPYDDNNNCSLLFILFSSFKIWWGSYSFHLIFFSSFLHFLSNKWDVVLSSIHHRNLHHKTTSV